MKHWLWIGLMVAAFGAGARGAEPATTQPSALSASPGQERWMTLARPLWAEGLTAAGAGPTVSSMYPTEPALVFLTAYDFTRDPRYADRAATQLEYAHTRATNGLLLTLEGLCSRDYQARQTYNFYLAYRILGEGKYLRWADEAAAAMLRTIPRSAHACRGETHLLFAADLLRPAAAAPGAGTQCIDVNQNSEIALAFTLLYHDPASAYFQHPDAKAIAYEELLASMSLQDLQSGAIPLTENISGADTAYGSYAAFSWTWCQMLWQVPRFEPHVRAAGRWLAANTDLTRGSERVYPKAAKTWIPSWEANYRLPLFWYCGIDAGAYVAALRERTAHPEQTPGDHPAPLYWAYFDVMGLPRAFYLDGIAPERPNR